MIEQSDPTEMPTSHPLIQSSRVEGTRVYESSGKRIGAIDHLIIDKASGRVVYVVMTFGGVMGIGAQSHTIPWEKLGYDPLLGGYKIDITQTQLNAAPPSDEKLWRDRRREQELREHWEVPPHYGF